MFQSPGSDREPFIESTAIHGVELWQKVKRVSALVELGRFPSDDLEPPPHCRDNDDPGIEHPSHTNFPRRSSVFGQTAEGRVQSTNLG